MSHSYNYLHPIRDRSLAQPSAGTLNFLCQEYSLLISDPFSSGLCLPSKSWSLPPPPQKKLNWWVFCWVTAAGGKMWMRVYICLACKEERSERMTDWIFVCSCQMHSESKLPVLCANTPHTVRHPKLPHSTVRVHTVVCQKESLWASLYSTLVVWLRLRLIYAPFTSKNRCVSFKQYNGTAQTVMHPTLILSNSTLRGRRSKSNRSCMDLHFSFLII